MKYEPSAPSTHAKVAPPPPRAPPAPAPPEREKSPPPAHLLFFPPQSLVAKLQGAGRGGGGCRCRELRLLRPVFAVRACTDPPSPRAPEAIQAAPQDQLAIQVQCVARCGGGVLRVATQLRATQGASAPRACCCCTAARTYSVIPHQGRVMGALARGGDALPIKRRS
jgi:hypothetical protein